MTNITKNIKRKQTNTFNPVKEDTDGVQAKRMIWSTQSISLALTGLEQGRKLIYNPFYENNTKLLKGDLVFDRTPEEIEEWKKCATDILYFAEKYCKLMTPEGIRHIKLRDYQKRYLKHLEGTQLSIYLACRQCGKTTTSAIYMLHYILFNVDKNSLVLGNKRKTAVEILSKLKSIYYELPFFLKPGIYKWNEAEIVLDNGCRCMAEATTINSGISFTFHCVLADEFAHVPKNIIDTFYNNLFPTITAGKAKFIITSTQNGYNLFYRLYKAAEAGDNDYKPFKTDWYEVPEWNPETRTWDKRDEEWHQRQVANYGSEEAFNRQFGTNFDVSAKTLISQKVLNERKQHLTEFIEKDLYGVPNSNFFKWDPEYEPMDQLKKDHIIITCDLAEGGGQDYTVYSFFKMINPGTNDLKCIGIYRSNKLNRQETTLALQTLCCLYCNPDRYLLSYEYNTYGELFYNQLNVNMEKMQLMMNKFDPSVLVKYYNESGTKFNYGIKITAGNKTPHCLLYKESYERNSIINESTLFMSELANFCDDGTGHFKASFGHDDMVMTNIQLEFVKKTLQYKIMRGDYDEMMMTNHDSRDPNIYNPFESSIDVLNRMYGESNDDIFSDPNYNPNESRLNRFM